MSTALPRLSHAERTELSDAKMLAAAVDLIVTRGVQGTTLKEVGTLAGYSRGLAGYRFGSKPGLFEYVLRAVSDHWLAELTKVTQGKLGLDAICAATDSHFRFCKVAPKPVQAFYALWFAAADPEVGLREVISGIHTRRRRDVEEWILKDPATSSGVRMSASGIAGQFVSAIIGIVYQWVIDGKDIGTIEELHSDLKNNMTLLLGR
ncbi:MAG: TetR/AcrR family transcriptional regulator [Pseudomonadota bacterium]